MEIFKKHPDFVLLGLAILLILILIASFIWGAQVIIAGFNKAFGFDLPKNQGTTGFDLRGAQALDLKGLLEQQ